MIKNRNWAVKQLKIYGINNPSEIEIAQVIKNTLTGGIDPEKVRLAWNKKHKIKK